MDGKILKKGKHIENLLFSSEELGSRVYYRPKWNIPFYDEKPSQEDFRNAINSICSDFYEKYGNSDKSAVIVSETSLMSSLTYVMLNYIESNARKAEKEGVLESGYSRVISGISTIHIPVIKNTNYAA